MILPAKCGTGTGTGHHGLPEDIVEQLAEYGRAGGNEVVVHVAGVYSEH